MNSTRNLFPLTLAVGMAGSAALFLVALLVWSLTGVPLSWTGLPIMTWYLVSTALETILLQRLLDTDWSQAAMVSVISNLVSSLGCTVVLALVFYVLAAMVPMDADWLFVALLTATPVACLGLSWWIEATAAQAWFVSQGYPPSRVKMAVLWANLASYAVLAPVLALVAMPAVLVYRGVKSRLLRNRLNM
ncbi:MAG: hypothetical protein D6E12_05160 [Desulfovibrio sp.]|nr:MAG: hypothetical protein D6E12_05160 [Desulfovibrio sp.]